MLAEQQILRRQSNLRQILHLLQHCRLSYSHSTSVAFPVKAEAQVLLADKEVVSEVEQDFEL